MGARCVWKFLRHQFGKLSTACLLRQRLPTRPTFVNIFENFVALRFGDIEPKIWRLPRLQNADFFNISVRPAHSLAVALKPFCAARRCHLRLRVVQPHIAPFGVVIYAERALAVIVHIGQCENKVRLALHR